METTEESDSLSLGLDCEALFTSHKEDKVANGQ